LRKIRPELIHISMTPFGRNSANADAPATDLTILAGGGPVWNCGYDDHTIPPVRGGGNQGYQTGCHYAVLSALTALVHRLSTGAGQFVDVSMHEAANVTTEAGSYIWLVAQQTVQRQTGRHAAPVPTSETQIQCADGVWVNTGMPPRSPTEFAALLEWIRTLGLEEQYPEAVFLEMGITTPVTLADIGVKEEATAIFAAARGALHLLAHTLPAYDFFIGCQNRGFAAGIVYAPEEAFEDAHFKARGFQVEVEHPEFGRSFRYPGAPYAMPASPWKISRRAPRLGEHNAELLT
jgi:crotonobetainyl-CoA:carnitine CoA-transferase CaiB-like acyl-CoA transferase